MAKPKPPIVIGVMRASVFSVLFFLWVTANAQNPKIKCYFNQPVNTALSTGTNAVYLNTTFVDTLIAYINRAKSTIDLCVYNYYVNAGDGMDAIATAINNAYNRGVVIRWIGNGSSSNSGWATLNANINTLSSPTTFGYGICHNKFVVFDVNTSNTNDAIVWTGSYNFSRQQNDNDFNNVVIIQDKPVATAYYNEFNKMWGGTGAAPNLANSNFGPNKTASAVNSFTVNGTPVEVYFSPKDNTSSHLQTQINTANSDLFFGIYTFTDTMIANRIKNKYNAGVAVRGIMDQFSNTYTPYTILNPIMGSNLKVYSSSYLYHNKVMLIDALNPNSDPQVCAGSYNWSTSADTKNDENMIVIHDATVANQFYQSLCKNFTNMGGAACTTVGIENYNAEKAMAVYPNPAHDILNIHLAQPGETNRVEIVDLQGRVVATHNFAGDHLQADISALAPGIYVLLMRQGRHVVAEKISKQ